MDRDTKEAITVVVVAAIIIGCGFIALFAYSGLSSPLTVVESGSMQHSDKAQIGVIDTADVIIMRDPSQCSITSFVEGHRTGYQKFGDYGDVIIYKRPNANPVIHRAIVWLEYLGNGKWAAPSLQYYDDWNVSTGDYSSMSGILTINGLGWRNLSASVDLNTLPEHSGYLTNGDNNCTNGRTYFDQSTSIARDVGLIQKDDIKAVAGLEVPYLGCIKMFVSNINVNQIPTNTVPCLFVLIIDFVFFFIILAMLLNLTEKYWDYRKNKEND